VKLAGEVGAEVRGLGGDGLELRGRVVIDLDDLGDDHRWIGNRWRAADGVGRAGAGNGRPELRLALHFDKVFRT